jgi:hypothetical protein
MDEVLNTSVNLDETLLQRCSTNLVLETDSFGKPPRKTIEILEEFLLGITIGNTINEHIDDNADPEKPPHATFQ